MLFVDEGVVERALFALKLQLQQLLEGALLQLAVDRGIRHQNARGAAVKLADIPHLVVTWLLSLKLQKLDSIITVAVGDGSHGRTIVLVLAHRDPCNLTVDRLRIVPSELQLSLVVRRRQRKNAGHGAEFEWLFDPPVVPRLLRQRLEQTGAAVVVQPAKPQDAVHAVAQGLVAACNEACTRSRTQSQFSCAR